MPTNNNPAVIGVVRSISGTNVSVLLYSSMNSTISYIYGNGYKIGQVGGFVKIPQGFVNLYGIIVQIGADAVPESLREEANTGYRWMTVQLVGEGAKGQPFERGISQYPMIDDEVYIVTEDDLVNIYGRLHGAEFVSVGTISGAENIPALIDVNKLVSRHCAIVGSTGTGKSTTVAGLVNTLMDNNLFPSSRIILIDIHGEYGKTFKDRANVFRVTPEDAVEKNLVVPYWAMSFDEFVSFAFGDISDNDRHPLSDLVLKLKKLTIEKNPVLFSYLNKDNITVDTPIPFSIKRLFLYLYRQMFSTHTCAGTGQRFCAIDEDFDATKTTEAFATDADEKPLTGSLEPLVFPQYKEQQQSRVFLSSAPMSIKRQLISLRAKLNDPRFDFALNPKGFVPDSVGYTDSDINALLRIWMGEKTLSVFDVSGVPSGILHDIIGILLRVMYDSLFWGRNLAQGGKSRPLLIIMEEAHNYLGSDNSSRASKIVRRIVKEGRKYGISAMIVSQRPSEIDPTILSQCGTTIALRLTNSNDRGIVANTVSDNLSNLVNMLPILKTGESIIVGEAVRMPMRACITFPDKKNRPDSNDPVVASDEKGKGGWNNVLDIKDEDYPDIVKAWRLQQVNFKK